MLEDPQAGRQFAPEYSQSSYEHMQSQDWAVGNYLEGTGPNANFGYGERERLISIVQDLHKKKDYKPETLHLAGNLADRYLSLVLRKGESVPNLFVLGATVTLMAAKLEQPISPSFNRMLALLPPVEQARTNKQDLVDLEERILLALEFGLHAAGPIPFLERFQRIFGLDQEKADHDFK